MSAIGGRHGFSTRELGYTLDGVPLGDQRYGNYNGLSVSRAITSDSVSRVTISSGAVSLGVASQQPRRGHQDVQRGYVSYLDQHQRAWTFDGHQRGHQVN